MTTLTDEDLDLAFAALADPTRRAILNQLSKGDAGVNQLAEPFALTQQAVSKHIKVLEHAGLISRTRIAQSRPCHLETRQFIAVADWVDRHRALWDERYDRLGEHIRNLSAKGKTSK